MGLQKLSTASNRSSPQSDISPNSKPGPVGWGCDIRGRWKLIKTSESICSSVPKSAENLGRRDWPDDSSPARTPQGRIVAKERLQSVELMASLARVGSVNQDKVYADFKDRDRVDRWL